jgi:hypothetical protein
MRTLLLASFVVVQVLGSQERVPLPACTVVFSDGTEIVVTECAFRYEYGAGKEPPRGLYFKQNTISTNLLLETGRRTERGVTVADERTIPGREVASIAIEWTEAGTYRDVKEVTVTLKSGESIRVARLLPPDRLLSNEPYVFEKRVYLEGNARLGDRPGRFSKELSVVRSVDPPSELVRQLRIQ